MRFDDIQNAQGLADRLRELNSQMRNDWKLGFDDQSKATFANSQLHIARHAALNALRRVITEERNDVLQALKRLGVTFNEEGEQ